jgi:hypothetical protein
MDPVADNEHPREQPAAPPPAVRPPTEVTPDQVRQFQEFQRFQELMREQAEKGFPPPDTPPPPGFLAPWGQPPKQSLPKRLLKAAVGKIITGVVILAVLIVGGYLAIDYKPTASQTGGGKTEDNFILPENPYEAVRKIYKLIANGQQAPDGGKDLAQEVCRRFEDGGKKFVADMGYDSCESAVMGLAAKVTNVDDYAESMPSYTTTFNPATETEVQISSCADSRGGIKGGPPLGAFTVKKDLDSKPGPNGGKQWVITDHENEPSCATGSTTPSN